MTRPNVTNGTNEGTKMPEENALQPYLDYDLDAAEGAASEAKETAAAEASVFFTVDGGENVIRIIPPAMAWQQWFADNGKKPDPFFVLWKHFYERPDDPGKYVSVPCPRKMKGEPCPICAQVAHLKASKDALDQEIADDMEAKHKAIVNVVDRDNEKVGPLIWELSYPYGKWKGKSMYEKVRSIMVGRARRNLVTPGPDGFDLIIQKEGSGRQGTSYTFGADINASPLAKDPEAALGWINGQHDLREYVLVPTPEQMEAILRGDAMSPIMLNLDGTQKALPGADGDAQPRSSARRKPAAAEPAPEDTAGDYVDTTASAGDEDELQF